MIFNYWLSNLIISIIILFELSSFAIFATSPPLRFIQENNLHKDLKIKCLSSSCAELLPFQQSILLIEQIKTFSIMPSQTNTGLQRSRLTLNPFSSYSVLFYAPFVDHDISCMYFLSPMDKQFFSQNLFLFCSPQCLV